MMLRHLLPISALLLGAGLLKFAGGMNGLILPLRGEAEGFTPFALGALGTSWAVGFVTGSLTMARLVGRTGHVRAFGVMCAMATFAVLMSLLLLNETAWILLRSISGFCFAGAAMIVESWLSERASGKSRGVVFGTYKMINLLATTAGQLALSLGDPTGYIFFIVPAIVYCLALVPTAVSEAPAPAPLVRVHLDLRRIWRSSPIAVVAIFCVGVANGAFNSLAAVYATLEGFSVPDVTLFVSVPLLAGAFMQIPVGLISDRVDRRMLLVFLSLTALVASVVFVSIDPAPRLAKIGLGTVFGAAIFTMYAVIVAHANDQTKPGGEVQLAAGILVIFGVGSMVGPTVAGAMISAYGPWALFTVTGAAHTVMILFTLLLIARQRSVPRQEKSNTPRVDLAASSTPETAAFATGQDPQEPFEPAEP